MIRILFILLILSSCQSAKQILKEEDPIKQVLADHACDQEEKYGLEMVASGTPEQEKVDQFVLHFIAYKKLKVPGVRRLIILSVEEFINRINCDDEARPHLKNHPVTIDQVKFNIGFGQNNGDFMEPPYIAYAYLKDRKIHYCYYDNLFGKFTDYDDVEESYEVAKRMVMNSTGDNK